MIEIMPSKNLYTLCPVCKNPLSKVQNQAVCKNGHSFDFAKEGYLYLLKPNDKKSQDPGDNKDMVNARRDFLDGDFYLPLASKIAQIIDERYHHPITLIDAGVGTGYYLSKIIEMRNTSIASTSQNQKDVYLGADISKWAVKIASKRNPLAECCVASVFQLPYADKCADVITCIFSPYAMSEYARVLKNDGVLIVASPCENHLLELRKALYDNVRNVETPLSHQGFDAEDELHVNYTFNLDDSTQIANLLTMTPYVYKSAVDRVSLVKNSQHLSLTADFKITILKKSMP